MKTSLIFLLLGALLGVIAASYVVPPALSWYSTPAGLPGGAQIQALVNPADVIRYATDKLIRGQAIAGVIGAVIGLVIGVVFARRGRPAGAVKAPSAS